MSDSEKELTEISSHEHGEHHHHSDEGSHEHGEHHHHSDEGSHEHGEHHHHSDEGSHEHGEHHHHSHSGHHSSVKTKKHDFKRLCGGEISFKEYLRRKEEQYFRIPKKKRILLELALTAVLVLAILYLVPLLAKRPVARNAEKPVYRDEIKLSASMQEDAVYLVNPAIVEYLDIDITSGYQKTVKPSDFLKSGKIGEECFAKVSFRITQLPEDTKIYSFSVEYANNEQWLNSTMEILDKNASYYIFRHLFTNAKYYYRITVYTNKGTATASGEFQTTDTPRILSLEGLYNVRDIGNWQTSFGSRIKQGMILRGSEGDGAYSNTAISNQALFVFLNDFSIKTDFDLRGKWGNCKDIFGVQVNHFYYDAAEYENIFTESGKENMKRIFTDLANPDNYPLYLHDVDGCDRTGTVCYVLEALLGVSEGDCLREYGLSDVPLTSVLKIQEGLSAYNGSTLRDRASSYLIDCGITVEQINAIRQILLEECD